MAKRITQTEFIEKAKQVHEDKYDYSKVNYTNKKTKVTIVCPIHGEFKQSPDKHLYGQGCPKCGKLKAKKPTITKEQFIVRSKEKHGDKYDYSKSNIVNSTTKIEIICPVHGPFWQTPNMHMQGQGCPECGKNKSSQVRSLTVEKFIEKAKKIHGDKYDYSLIKEINGNKDKVPIICPTHGIFEQNAYTHYTGTGCPKCGREKAKQTRTKTFNTFIRKLNEINPSIKCLSDKYINTETKVKVKCLICEHEWEATPHSLLSGKGCSKCAIKHISELNTKTHEQFIQELSLINPNIKILSNYINNKEYVDYKCLICGNIHKNTPNHLLRGVGCPTCAINKRLLTQEEWITKANKIHNNKYNYTKVIYVKGSEKVCIICPEHGEFWQRADQHLLGRGCPKCSRTKGEQWIANWLETNNIQYEEQVTINVKQLARTSNFVNIDFVVNYNNKTYYIEYNGEQHYRYIPYFHKGGSIDFENQVRRDEVLRDYCKENNIYLIEIKYDLSPIEINDYLNKIFNE